MVDIDLVELERAADGGRGPGTRVAELPGLVLALSDRYGPIRQLMLNSVTWDCCRFGRLVVGSPAPGPDTILL